MNLPELSCYDPGNTPKKMTEKREMSPKEYIRFCTPDSFITGFFQFSQSVINFHIFHYYFTFASALYLISSHPHHGCLHINDKYPKLFSFPTYWPFSFFLSSQHTFLLVPLFNHLSTYLFSFTSLLSQYTILLPLVTIPAHISFLPFSQCGVSAYIYSPFSCTVQTQMSLFACSHPFPIHLHSSVIDINVIFCVSFSSTRVFKAGKQDWK